MPEPCQECGKKATINYQLVWIRWNIKEDGEIDTSNPSYKNCDENNFYCERCYVREVLDWSEETINSVYGEVSE